MFCLRSYLVLLFLPINASPIFVLSFFILTYLLNRPCVYCSLLLLILFISSCYWSDQCFFDLHGNWFEPRHLSSPLPNPLPHATSTVPTAAPHVGESEAGFLIGVVNETAKALGKAAAEGAGRMVGTTAASVESVGALWNEGVRSWVRGRVWRVPCLDVYIRL